MTPLQSCLSVYARAYDILINNKKPFGIFLMRDADSVNYIHACISSVDLVHMYNPCPEPYFLVPLIFAFTRRSVTHQILPGPNASFRTAVGAPPAFCGHVTLCESLRERTRVGRRRRRRRAEAGGRTRYRTSVERHKTRYGRGRSELSRRAFPTDVCVPSVVAR